MEIVQAGKETLGEWAELASRLFGCHDKEELLAENTASEHFHNMSEFRETERVICFVKDV